MSAAPEAFGATLAALMNICRSGDTTLDAVCLDHVVHAVKTEQEDRGDVRESMWYRIRGRGQPERERLAKIEGYKDMPDDGRAELEANAQEWLQDPAKFWDLVMPAVAPTIEGHEHLLLTWRAAEILRDGA
ncbi:hypothetical protein Slin15195_G128490 [Septoria linicola]|uniref:Uncharacterized protein n=1 Tax=Septoria linicola TaxID=215465 RepID=A0A9Q9B769_9PEZI|nr:hypothetical protein Slin14017_G084640 [Septoria linicola]USW59530.1 hypothetical protein Slin15195_G128490 [Septoria linicola]